MEYSIDNYTFVIDYKILCSMIIYFGDSEEVYVMV